MKLEPGGKPSTRFPPGRFVELSTYMIEGIDRHDFQDQQKQKKK